jgi:Holliday junction resolvasome RuvABC endonuclease subunit
VGGDGRGARAEGALVSKPETVWGIDIGVSRLAFAFAPLPNGPIEVETLRCDTEFREGQRLGLIDRQVRIFSRQLNGAYPAAVVWVEAPTGAHPSPALMYVTGVVQAALFETLAVPVWTIPVSKWKSRSVSHGNASKAQVQAWAEARGARVDSQDEADAFCIAYAGRDILTTRRWDAAA